jgi:polyferredoxin
MSTSHYASRPAQTDKILSAWLKNPHNPANELKKRRLYAAIWMAAGGILLILDILAIRFFATDAVEALVLAALTAPTGIFVILAALEARK